MSQENEIEIQHRIVIEEDDIEISDLPNEIRNAMRRFNTKLKEFEVSGNADLFHELMQDDIVIADNITTWIEDNLSEEEEEDDSYDDDSKAQTPQTQTPQAQTPQAPQAQAKQVHPLEQKVRDSIKNGIISVEELEKIIDREPDYPTDQIGSLRLRKQYLKPFYEVV
jgi:hypothetical protein